MPTPQDVRRTTTPIFSVLMVLIGIALVIRMAAIGNVVGVVLGVLFSLAGGGRLYLAWKVPR
jgi:hypothetical protein